MNKILDRTAHCPQGQLVMEAIGIKYAALNVYSSSELRNILSIYPQCGLSIRVLWSATVQMECWLSSVTRGLFLYSQNGSFQNRAIKALHFSVDKVETSPEKATWSYLISKWENHKKGGFFQKETERRGGHYGSSSIKRCSIQQSTIQINMILNCKFRSFILSEVSKGVITYKAWSQPFIIIIILKELNTSA